MSKTSPAPLSHCLDRRGRGRRLALALVLGCAVLASSAGAQVIVVDPGSIAANEQGFATQLAKTVEQYAKQIQQYATQLQQYQQMLSSIPNLANGVSLAPNPLQHITNTAALIQGKCASTGATALVSNVMNAMSSLLSQSITQTQHMLCAQIVTMQIGKYNKTVDMLDKLNNYGQQFQQVEDMASSISTLADSGRADTQVEKYSSALTTEMGNWQAQMQADDTVIETLQSQQSILGHIALKGSNTVLGNMVQAAAFAAAFQ